VRELVVEVTDTVTEQGRGRWHSPALTVWAYDSPMGAAAGHVRMRELQRRGAIAVEDAITVTWVPGTHRPRVGHLRAPRSVEQALPGHASVLGALVDLLLLPGAEDPVAEVAVALEHTGVDRSILEELHGAVVPGCSVLVVLTSGADPGQARDAIQRGLDRGDLTMTYAVLAEDAVPALQRSVGELLLAAARAQRRTGG
jgi:uncharacterized membrane protein